MLFLSSVDENDAGVGAHMYFKMMLLACYSPATALLQMHLKRCLQVVHVPRCMMLVRVSVFFVGPHFLRSVESNLCEALIE